MIKALSTNNDLRSRQLKSKNSKQNTSVSFAANDHSKAAHGTEIISKAASSSVSNVSKSKISVNKALPAMHISFKGNKDKKTNQFLFIAPEMRGVAGGAVNRIYSNGGLGVVTDEASHNWVQQYTSKGADVRVVIPYHTDENDFENTREPGGLTVASGDPKKPTFKQVAADYQLQGDEKFAVVNYAIDKNGKTLPKKKDGVVLKDGEGKEIPDIQHAILEDTGIKGSIKRVKTDLTDTEEIPYRLFKVAGSGQPNKDGKATPTVYLMHTPELATYRKAYNVDARQGAQVKKISKNPSNNVYACFDDLQNANSNRASAHALPSLNEEAHGNFNPANIMLHDRQAFGFAVDAAEQSANGNEYFNGLKIDSRYHNPGRDYQGAYGDPVEFFRIVASDKDFDDLKAHPEFDFVKSMATKGIDERKKHEKALEAEAKELAALKKQGKTSDKPKLKQFLEPENIYSKEELDKLKGILDPVIGGFKDDFGTYNMCAIPINAHKTNPENFSAGTVSKNYGKEMSSQDTPDIAKGMTNTLASIKRIDVTNGSTPANMKTGEIGEFGSVGNGFNDPEITKGYTPYVAQIDKAAKKVTNMAEVHEAKQKNKKWIIDTVAEATTKGKLAELFYPESERESGSTVLGGLSKHKEGDKLFFTWGRPDPQKGIPVTLEGLLHFYKRKDVPLEKRLSVKLMGSAGPYKTDSREWKKIVKTMDEIAKIDKGAFKDNVCFINGRFTSRAANASDFSIFTSRYEPCGITPLESAAAGTPASSIKTGGAPDFITPPKNGDTTEATGLLTKHPFLVKPEVIKPGSTLTGDELDDARIEFSSGQVSDMFKEASEIIDDPAKHAKVEENQLLLEIDWHNNHAFNEGRSANEIYLEDAFGLDSKELTAKEARNQSPLKSLKGKIAAVAGQVKEKADVVIDKAAQTAEKVEEKAGAAVDKVKEKADVVIDKAAQTAEKVEEKAGAAVDKVTDAADKATDEAKDKAKDAGKEAESFLSTTKGKVTVGVSAGAVLLGLGYYMFGKDKSEKPAGFSAKA